MSDKSLTLDFMIQLIGYDPLDAHQRDIALNFIYMNQKVIDQNQDPLVFLCLTHSVTKSQLDACIY